MSEAKRLLSDLESRIREAINNAADGLNDATRWDQADEADGDGKTPMDKLVRRISEMQSEITAVILIKADLYDHALDCVDEVFQKCSKNPKPILPDFCLVGESKFRAVVRLAKQHVKVLNELRVVLAELCGVRRHVATILADNGMPPASDIPENPS